MNGRITPNPRPYTWAISAVFVLLVTVGPFSLVYVPSVVLVPGDGAATVANLAEHAGLVRAGLLGELAIALTELVMVAALYQLFRPVSEGLAVLAAGARGAMATLQGAALVPGLLATTWSTPDLVLATFEVREAVVTVWQAFFAVHCLVLGVLIARSRLVPGGLGVLMSVAGVGYGAMALGPLLGSTAWTGPAQALALTEIPFFLWVLVRGVSKDAWKALVL